jgi:hypothetical protein
MDRPIMGGIVRAAILTSFVVCLIACDRIAARELGAPARLVAARADTVYVNSRHAAQLPIRVLDSAGHELPARGIRYAWLSGDSLAITDSGRVTCARRLDATVRASLGDLSTRFVVHCRPIAGIRFVFDGGVPLYVGGPSHELALPAIGVDGEPVSELAATVTVGDTNVAALHGLTVEPRGAGSTSAEFDFGDCVWAVGIEVAERVPSPDSLRAREDLFLESPLRLVDGEVRGWRLPRGEYRVALVPALGAARLALSTTAMNCSRWLGSDTDLHCIALAGASVDVRNPRPAGAGGTLTGALFFQRWDLPARRERATGPRRPARGAKPLCKMR